MPEPGGFSQSTLAMSLALNPPTNATRLFFNALAGRDARGPAKALSIVLRDLRAAGKHVDAVDLMPEAHRLSVHEAEVWHIVATALAAAANESPTP